MNRTTALIGALLASTAPAWAGDKPLYQPAPDWVKPAVTPDPGNQTAASPAMVLFDQQQRVADGQVWAYVDQATRAVSPQSLTELGTVQLAWQPDAGDLIVHRAEILRGPERIDLMAQGQKFEVLRRELQLEQLMINGTLTATLNVEGLRVGDILRIAYSTTDRDAALKGNAQTIIPLVAAPVQAGFARARLSWPAGDKLAWRHHADGPAPKTVVRGGFQELDISLPLAKAAEIPADAPARFRKLGIIEASSFADWQAVSRTMAPLYRTEGTVAPNGPLAAEVAKIAAKSADPRTRAAMALRLVQDEIRYFYRGLDGGNYKPQAPADTWTRRYGDCKAKTMLLLALLSGLGIEGEAVLVSSSLGDIVPARLPSAGAFDHVVVRATIEGKPIWLDGTQAGTRLADLNDVPAFRNVLPLRDAGAALETLAMQVPARPTVETFIDVDQRAGVNLPSPVSLTFVVRGALAETMRAATLQVMDKDVLTNAAQGMANEVLGDVLLSDRSIAYDPETATATIRATGIISTKWRKRDGRYRLALDRSVAHLEFAPDRARAAWKDIPVMTAPEPLLVVNRYRVRLPDGGANFTIDGDRSFGAPLAGATITRNVALADGAIVAEDRLGIGGGEIAASELGAARAQVALAKRRLLEIVGPAQVAPRWAVAMRASKVSVAPLLDAYDKAIKLDSDPNSVLGFQNRASFFGGIYDYKSAIADLDRVIAKQPDADRYFWRARLRLAVGDQRGARADVDAGLALQPDSTAGTDLLASLRFEAGEREQALAMLDERIAAGGQDKAGVQIAKAMMLGEAGRVDEGTALVDEVVAAKPSSPEMLNGRCWFRGTMKVQLEGALKDCTKAIELGENPAAYLDSRALVYFRMDRPNEALADLDAALETAPELASSLFLRGVIRKRGGHPRAAEDLAAARLISPQIDKHFGKWGIAP